MRFLLAVIVLATTFLACGEEKPVQQQPAPAPAPAEKPVATLPSIPLERLQYLWENCDYVDYVFYKLPISMSLDNKESVRNALSHVASEPAPLLPQCNSIGRIFFVVKGNNELMAEMYYSPGCTYFVFLKDEKPAYANYMTPEAVQYFNNIFTQAGIKMDQLGQ